MFSVLDHLQLVDTLLGVLGCWLLLRLYSRIGVIVHAPQPPPGPPGLPLLGNLTDMPTHHEWETFAEWAKEYGDVFSLKVLNKRIVVVNSLEAAYDVFERRSSLYSDRPYLPMLNDLMGFDWNFGMMHYGDRWKRHRKLFYQHANPEASERYLEIQLNQIRRFLPKLLKKPNECLYLFRHLSADFIMELAYGIRVKDNNDPYVELAEKAVEGLIEAAVPGAFLVDTIPIMRYIPHWFPGAIFRRKAAKWREHVVGMCVKPFQAVKAALSAGTANSSIAVSLLEDLAGNKNAPADEEEIIQNTAAVAYLGGTDTMSTVLSWFIIAMALYPEIQRKAQAEVDSVVEGDRLPDFNDRRHLPYIYAIIKEILRWKPVAPLAIPHCVTEDNIYNGRLIRKGTLALGNAWAILHDTKAYGQNVRDFDPERFLKPGVPYPDAAFGFGRRICPGRYIADNFLFVAMSSILKVYDITQAKESNGDPIPIDLSTVSGAVAGPRPFKCEIKPRSTSAAEIVAQLEDVWS